MANFIDNYTRFCGSKALAAIIAANVGVWLITFIFDIVASVVALPAFFGFRWLALPSSWQTWLLQPWSLFTYMVTQFSFLHLLFNMLWLFWFGRIILTIHTDRRLAFCYIFGGLIGGIAFLSANSITGPAGSYLCGASASVLAIMTASAFLMPEFRCNLLLFGEVRLKWLALGCIILTFAGEGGYSTGSFCSHIGGILAGIIFALSLKKGKDLSKLFDLRQRTQTNFQSRTPRRSTRTPQEIDNFIKASEGRLCDADRLDTLLDKIRMSGYNSLSSTEKKELNAISRRLDTENRD